MRKFLAVGAVLAAVLAPCVAEAAAVTYRFSAASFTGQGNVAGTFVYDTASSQVTAANITYDAGQYVNGDAAPAATYAHLDQPVSPRCGSLSTSLPVLGRVRLRACFYLCRARLSTLSPCHSPKPDAAMKIAAVR